MIEIVHNYSWKNDGEWHTYDPLTLAIMEAVSKLYEAGGTSWETILVEKMPCDNRDKNDPNSHYPEICYHYQVTIEGEHDVS